MGLRKESLEAKVKGHDRNLLKLSKFNIEGTSMTMNRENA